MKREPCPKCQTMMQPTYEPYELRCPNCGYWFDTYTGKEIDPKVAGEAFIRNLERKEWVGQWIETEDDLDIGTGGDGSFRVRAGSFVEIVDITDDGFMVEWSPDDDCFGPIRFEILREDVATETGPSDLVAAALSLPSSAEVQAEVHLIDYEQDNETTVQHRQAWDDLTE